MTSAPRMASFGLLVPSTNTVAEPELRAICSDAVALHTSRYNVGSARMSSAEAIAELLATVDVSLTEAALLLRGIGLRRLINIMSAQSFRDGLHETQSRADRLEAAGGAPVTDGPRAFRGAFQVLGVSRVALLTPYHESVESAVVKVFDEFGVETVASRSLHAESTRSVAFTDPRHIRRALTELATSAPQAIVQIGGNLPFARMAAAAEQWLDVPVLAANTTMIWHALRSEGWTEPRPGWGCLLEEY